MNKKIVLATYFILILISSQIKGMASQPTLDPNITIMQTMSDYMRLTNNRLSALEDGTLAHRYRQVSQPSRIASWLSTALLIGSAALMGKMLWHTFVGSPAPKAAQKGEDPFMKNLAHTQPYSFKDVAGKIPQDIMEVTDFIKNNEKYAAMGARMPKGILLVGPPGTGKTSLARAIAGEAEAYFISVSATAFIEMWVGLGAQRVRTLFSQAREATKSGMFKKAIIFIDEIDAIGCERSGDIVGERSNTLNELLNQMDGFTIDNSIFVMAATNRVQDLDAALKRPGRFDRIAYVGLPDAESREDIIKLYAQKIRLDERINLKALAFQTNGMSGAELGNLVNEAAIRAVRENAPHTTQSHFEQAIDAQRIAP